VIQVDAPAIAEIRAVSEIPAFEQYCRMIVEMARDTRAKDRARGAKTSREADIAGERRRLDLLSELIDSYPGGSLTLEQANTLALLRQDAATRLEIYCASPKRRGNSALNQLAGLFVLGFDRFGLPRPTAYGGEDGRRSDSFALFRTLADLAGFELADSTLKGALAKILSEFANLPESDRT
jgi:hypothetical protein